MATGTNVKNKRIIQNIIEFEKMQKEKGNSSSQGTTYTNSIPQDDNNMQEKKDKTSNEDISIHVEKYISGDKNAVQTILNTIEAYRKILIDGAMNIGKTFFTTNDLLQYAKSINKKIVIVIPGVAQLDNLNENKGLPVVHADMSYFDTDIVAVTPDSLMTKVIDYMKPQEYILVEDEKHQKILDNSYRAKAFKNIEEAEKNAFKIICMTATPRVLINESFDKRIKITTNNPIENKVMTKDTTGIKGNSQDVAISIIKKGLKKFDNVIFFQNDKKSNKAMAEILAEGNTTAKKVYKDNFQYSICIENQSDHINKTSWEWITKADTIQAGKENKEAKEGLLTANITFVTSVITAGIDLRLPKGNKGLLIIDANQRIDIDSFIQLIGRFREGIEVLILTKERATEKKYISFEKTLDKKLKTCGIIAKCIKDNNLDIEFYKGMINDNSLELVEDEWVVNTIKATAEAYAIWCGSLIYNISEFKRELKKQNAFEVVGNIEKCEWLQDDIHVGEDMKVLKTNRKEEFASVKEDILKFDDDVIMATITKNYDNLEDGQLEIIETYHDLRPVSHIEKLKTTGTLFVDDEGITDIVKAFKYFYSNPWSIIQNEIDAIEAKEVNKDIKVNGAEKYLVEGLYSTRTSKDIQQAKIRYELKDLEQKQGRISTKRIKILVLEMIKNGYIKGKDANICLNKNGDINDRKKSFKVLADIITGLTELIYNFKNDGRISSVKY